MKIGIFDSGLGGLSILKSIRARMPQYDYVFLGDTLHVPYGRRSPETIRTLTTRSIQTLFLLECELIIVACNTASSYALRDLQKNWLPHHAPNKRILGVIVPTLEAVYDSQINSIGLLATNSTIESCIYHQELSKMNTAITIHDQAAPLLVPLMENDGWDLVPQALNKYLAMFKKHDIDGLILGCTHYGSLAPLIQGQLPECRIFSQNQIIPDKLHNYLDRNKAIESRLNQNGSVQLYVTDLTHHFKENAARLFSPDTPLSTLPV